MCVTHQIKKKSCVISVKIDHNIYKYNLKYSTCKGYEWVFPMNVM